MVTAILKFEIRNSFAEWEQAFYSHQPITRAAGMFEIYHGHESDDEKKVCVVLNALSPEHQSICKSLLRLTAPKWRSLDIYSNQLFQKSTLISSNERLGAT